MPKAKAKAKTKTKEAAAASRPAGGGAPGQPELRRPTTPKAKTKEAAAGYSAAMIQRACNLIRQASDPTRLQILLATAAREWSVTDLCIELDVISQPAMSHHLALLRHGGLVDFRRSGKSNLYSLTRRGRKLDQVIAGAMVIAGAKR